MRLTRPGDGASIESWVVSLYDASVPLRQMNAPRAVPVSWPVQVSPPPCEALPPPQERQRSAAVTILLPVCMKSTLTARRALAPVLPSFSCMDAVGFICRAAAGQFIYAIEGTGSGVGERAPASPF